MKVINFNPQFIIWDYGYKFVINYFNLHFIIIIQIILIFFLLYYFNFQEIYFLYNMFFNNKLSINDIKKLNYYENIVADIESSKIYCSTDDYLHIVYKNNDIKAKSFNGEYISDCSKLLIK